MPRIMWAVGTNDGEFNWQAINAPSEQEAIYAYAKDTGNFKCERQWSNQQGPCQMPCEWCDAECRQDEPRDCLEATRVPMWDNKRKIKAMHWIKAGFGCLCEECGYETFAEAGAVIFRGVVYCEECRERRPWIEPVKPST